MDLPTYLRSKNYLYSVERLHRLANDCALECLKKYSRHLCYEDYKLIDDLLNADLNNPRINTKLDKVIKILDKMERGEIMTNRCITNALHIRIATDHDERIGFILSTVERGYNSHAGSEVEALINDLLDEK